MQTNDAVYRTILFREKERGWGYPVAHLLAMEFGKPEASTEDYDSKVRMYFSSEVVQIEGKSLRLLWDQLISELPEEIRCDTFTTSAGKYTVANIKIL